MPTFDPQLEHQRQGSSAGWIMFGLAIASFPFFGVLAMATRMLGPASIPIWFAAIGGATLLFRGPLGQAIARGIGGRTDEGPAEIPGEVYAELDELRARLGELEERVDFSERLLTKQGESRES